MSLQLVGRMPRAHEAVPYYQPILSMQTRTIIGYEALGRQVLNGQTSSLGPFFHSKEFSEGQQLRIDRILREKAIAKLAGQNTEEGCGKDRGNGKGNGKGNEAKLFLNLKPSWIYRMYKETGILPTLEFASKHGLNPSRIVVEITEEAFGGRLDELCRITQVYREHGCQIAIDDIGAGYSNYDRIAAIKPHILKIDLKLLKRSSTHDGYQALLNSFSILASQMGSSLLLEGVETRQDLFRSLKVGARYVQGYLFSEAREDLQKKEAYEDLLQEEMMRYTDTEVHRYRKLLSVQEQLGSVVQEEMTIRNFPDADALLERLAPMVPETAIRMYICRADGTQVTSNFSRSPAGQTSASFGLAWRKDPEFLGANWIWRPYFIPNILQMNRERRGILSQVYTDLDSSHLIQTYSCPLDEEHYWFLDLVV